MDIASETHLLTLTVPDQVPSGDAGYYWRAHFISSNGVTGQWSAAGGFTTAAADLGDEDGNGLPDEQELSGDADGAANGVIVDPVGVIVTPAAEAVEDSEDVEEDVVGEDAGFGKGICT